MTENKDKKFVEEFGKFYELFFECISDSVYHLADVQKKYSKQYDKLQEFNQNPKALEELMEKLTAEEKSRLFTILFTAGDFGMRFMNLMSSSVEEKKQFAKDLKDFVKKLKEEE